jgi:hypothetical protein
MHSSLHLYLSGRLANVDKLGLERGTAHEEAVDVGGLGWKLALHCTHSPSSAQFLPLTLPP